MAIELNRIVKGHRYDTSISILLASDELISNKTQTTTYLYRTRRGLFFLVRQFNDSSKKPKILPLEKDQAIEQFNKLPEKFQDFTEAFSDPEDIHGRPPLFEKPLIKTSLWLKEEMLEWLKKQPGTMSEVIRKLIQDAMDKNP
ncbi:MAG: hypothetical protein CVU40_15285 [Chloroflexi bacterium HGW-Chloroflexi-2]|jgi:hypothetical protein|nr:MAG: hypothetical protein CVU40_15285 [Chloroflexi bacterium HGW-Chloroflexi-2]